MANFKFVKKIKDTKFDVEDLHHYDLCLQIGNRDFQFCVIDNRNMRCLLYEDFALENVKTVNNRLQILQQIFEGHHLLTAGFWNSVRFSIKSFKFAMVPQAVFSTDGLADYLLFSTPYNPAYEEVIYYKHTATEAVNVFAIDKKLTAWIKEMYAQKEVKMVHQGSAFIEGLGRFATLPSEKTMSCLADAGILHIVITAGESLLYYNQFSIKKQPDFLKYIMLVFKEIDLSPKSSKILFWGGGLILQSSYIKEVKKYVRDVSFGSRPESLSFGYLFDDIPEHKAFDLFNIFYCA